MADYFTHFSCVLPLPDPAMAARAMAHFKAFEARLEDEEDRAPCLAVELIPAGETQSLWIHDDGNGEPDDVIALVSQIAPDLGLTGPWGFQWSHHCSRPLLGAFAGGAYVLDLATGDEVASLNTTTWLARVVADPSRAGEA
jgi:hypothetical protein